MDNYIIIKKPPVISKEKTIPLNSIQITYLYEYTDRIKRIPRCELKTFMHINENTIDINQFAANDGNINGRAKLISDFKKINVPITRQNPDNRCASKPDL